MDRSDTSDKAVDRKKPTSPPLSDSQLMSATFDSLYLGDRPADDVKIIRITEEEILAFEPKYEMVFTETGDSGRSRVTPCPIVMGGNAFFIRDSEDDPEDFPECIRFAGTGPQFDPATVPLDTR